MRYLGGKARIGKEIASVLRILHPEATRVYEPFMGGGNVTVELAERFPSVEASDAHPDLILMWQAAKAGWEPPATCTAEQYADLRHAAPSALRGLVGFGMSFGGKWFGGFVGTDTRRARVGDPGSAIRKQISRMMNVNIHNRDYLDTPVSAGDVIYLDPPYAGTTGYHKGFDNALFWSIADYWRAIGAFVYVSEYFAPPGWERVWEKTMARNMKSDFTTTVTVTEGLYA